ncbi:MAG: cytochrome P460 family protein [Alphaproteobacteria bacterium]
MGPLRLFLFGSTAIAAVALAGAVHLGAGPISSGLIAQAQAQNPCAARNLCAPSANPCNPCGAAAAAIYSTKCEVPRLVRAAAANPCAAKANPCAPRPSAGPCAPHQAANPCAAKANPCAAANPCSTCGAAPAVALEDREAIAAYDCLIDEMLAAYGKSGRGTARSYNKWKAFSTQAYVSETHGARYVRNYANPAANAYGRYERAGKLPTGSVLVKDSFMATPEGKLSVGPLFIMEKMAARFNADSGDWKYTMIMPDGSIFGETKGRNAAAMEFCIQCHAAAAEHDHLFFLPERYRASR